MFSKKECIRIVNVFAVAHARRCRNVRDHFLPVIGDDKLTGLVLDALTSADALVRYLQSRING